MDNQTLEFVRQVAAAEKVPDEIWLQICWELELPDLARLARVKAVHAVAEEVLYRKDVFLSLDVSTSPLFQNRYYALADPFTNNRWGSSALSTAAPNAAVALLQRSLSYCVHTCINHQAFGCNDSTGSLHCRGTPLYIAASHGHTRIVEILHDNGADLECPEGELRGHQTALGAALQESHETTALVLLERGASLDVICETDWFAVGVRSLESSALSAAIDGGCETVVSRLLSVYNMDVNGANTNGVQAIHRASMSESRITFLQLLISAGADVNVADRYGQTPLHYCCLTPSAITKHALDMLATAGANVNAQDMAGMTLLGKAADGLNIDAMMWLLQNGADPAAGEATQLGPWNRLAVFYDESDTRKAQRTLTCARLLHQYGFKVNKERITVFLGANSFKIPSAFQGDLSELRNVAWMGDYQRLAQKNWANNRSLLFLLKNFPPPYPSVYRGTVHEKAWQEIILALFGSASIHGLEIASILLEYVDNTIRNPHGKDLLMVLLGNPLYDADVHDELLRRCLSSDISPLNKDASNKTCLHWLASNSGVSPRSLETTLELLIDETHGHLINDSDNNNNTPLHGLLSKWALSWWDVQKVQSLIDAGANITLINSNGQTPLTVLNNQITLRNGSSTPIHDLLRKLLSIEAS